MIGYNIINANFANIVNEIKNAINNRIIDTMDPKTEKIKVNVKKKLFICKNNGNILTNIINL